MRYSVFRINLTLLLNMILLFLRWVLVLVLLLEDTVDIIILASIRRGCSLGFTLFLLCLFQVHEVLLLIILLAFKVRSLRISTSTRYRNLVIWILADSTLFSYKAVLNNLVYVLSFADWSLVVEVHLSHLLVDSWQTMSKSILPILA